MAEVSEPVLITVRYFAAARAAVGSDVEKVTLRSGVSVEELVDTLGHRNHNLARLLERCSFLCDGIAVRDRAQSLRTGSTIDVLPPFAGG